MTGKGIDEPHTATCVFLSPFTGVVRYLDPNEGQGHSS
jgi:hypothetical protein